MKLSISILLVLTVFVGVFAQNTFPVAKTIKVAADEKEGFSYPYYLLVPGIDANSEAIASRPILVVPNNTGKISDDFDVHENSAKFKMLQAGFVFGKLGMPILMPVFPRPEAKWKIYTHSLDRDTLLTSDPRLKRLDLQLKKMILSAQSKLRERNFNIDRKVFLYGFSASGMFANRFTFLHPKLVRGAAIGSPGGWPIAPISEYRNEKLRYPIGTGDFKETVGSEFDIESLRKVPIFVFLGDQDTNDSVVFRDGYELDDQKLIFTFFGDTPVGRWGVIRDIYKDSKLDAQFKLYKGIGHKPSSEMLKDVIRFFQKHLN